MKKVLCEICLVVVCMLPAERSPGGQKVELESVSNRIDLAELAPFLARGELSFVESKKNGKLKQVTVIGLINAEPHRVWSALTDYDHYAEFIPSVVEATVIKREGADVVVEYEIEVPGSNVEYTRRHRHFPKKRIEIWLEDEEGDIQTGGWRWEIISHAGGKKTILVHTAYYNVAESSWILRQFLKSNPTTEHGLNVASAQVGVRAMKKRAER